MRLCKLHRKNKIFILRNSASAQETNHVLLHILYSFTSQLQLSYDRISRHFHTFVIYCILQQRFFDVNLRPGADRGTMQRFNGHAGGLKKTDPPTSSRLQLSMSL